MRKELFNQIDVDTDEPNKILMFYFDDMYEHNCLLEAANAIIEKIGFNTESAFCCFPDMDSVEELCFEGVKFAATNPPEDDDWVTVTNEVCYKYLRLACERYVKLHPEDAIKVNQLFNRIDRYQEIIELFFQSSEIVKFTEHGNRVFEIRILNAEFCLGFNLPQSYRWWVASYVGGKIRDEEIFGIYYAESDEILGINRGVDIVSMYEFNQKTRKYKSNKLIICETKDNVFYFDMNIKNLDGDFPVYSLNKQEPYAIDFIDFLRKRIIEC